MRVLSIGECMAELAPSGTPGEFSLGFAGDTFNTAWYLARLAGDIEVSYFTAVGDDDISRKLVDFVKDSGINSEFIQTRNDRTIGLYLIALDNGERSFSYWRGQSAAKSLADEGAALEDAIAKSDLIFFSGITLAILDGAGRTTLLNALNGARAAGKIVVFDPNLRPRLWASPKEMTDAIMEAAAACDVALPSFEDEVDWFGDSTPKGTIERYKSAGASTVIVKNGGLPIHFADHQGEGQVAVDELSDLVDTTAAGDSFNSCILEGISSGRALSDSIQNGCQLARQVVQSKGALVPCRLDNL